MKIIIDEMSKDPKECPMSDIVVTGINASHGPDEDAYCRFTHAICNSTDNCPYLVVSEKSGKLPKSNEQKHGLLANEYQRDALRTDSIKKNDANYGSAIVTQNRLINGLMGLCGEAGECIDLYKKCLYQGHKLNKEHLALELGDVAWYLAIIADAIGCDLETILWMNIDKRKARYPNGFESDKSVHRKEGDV